MKLQLIPGLLLVLVLLAATARGEKETLSERVDQYLKTYSGAGDFSGVLLIARENIILFEKAYGYADPVAQVPNGTDTAFRIASNSKTFTAAAISILAEQGKIRMTDPLSRFIPGFPNGDKILVRHLLLHSSGVGVLDSPDLIRKCISTEDLVKRIADAPSLFSPGTDNSYSNEGYVLLAAIIQKASGEDYEIFLKKNIFQPLGMNQTGAMCMDWPVKKHGVGSIAGFGAGVAPMPFVEAGWNGPGSLYSTANDLLLWLKAANSDKLFNFSKLEYPYGWGKRNYSGKPLVEQTGQLGGYTSHMALYPQENLYFVLLNSVQSGMINRVPKDLEALVFGGTASTPPSAKERSPTPELSDYAVSFSNSSIPVPLRFLVKEGRLWMHWGENPQHRPLIMTAKDEFFLRAEYATLTFQRNDLGKISSLAYRFGESEPLLFVRQE